MTDKKAAKIGATGVRIHLQHVKDKETKARRAFDKKTISDYEQVCKVLNFNLTKQKSLTELSYRDFQKTDYWKIIRRYVRFMKENTCDYCRNKSKIGDQFDLHHLHYERRGGEWQYWKEDLVFLCRPCHAKVHGFER